MTVTRRMSSKFKIHGEEESFVTLFRFETNTGIIDKVSKTKTEFCCQDMYVMSQTVKISV